MSINMIFPEIRKQEFESLQVHVLRLYADKTRSDLSQR